ncbi:probable transcription factor At3g04930 isoform X1 [Spinacia oleracea]|uniref:Probable transcription factor At3g04930 isoform X1 n=1 Tax=Spinacia oleracea TaxID=3562 RepID=A0A9R0IGA0_SPIOL|nr:probable transcription factor At3g04930 isoform X1 [Spinacia oleracea]
MASEEDQPIYNDDDFDDDDDDSEPLNGGVPDDDVAVDSDSSSGEDSTIAGDSTAVTVAIPSSSTAISVAVPPPAPNSSSAVTIALPDPKRHRIDPLSSSSPIVNPEKKPIDDSRRLFQRLWTDEDEIELLQGFLDYTSGRGTTSSGHHHDTAAFYDQIKSKLQLEFNKNQLVEKLRRLKKKYRNVISKISSGKEFTFKSPHDQATFEISRKIWSNISPSFRGVAEFDDDDQNPNPNLTPGSNFASATPPRPPNSSFVVSHINLNNSATGMASTPMLLDQKAGSSGSYNHNNNNSNNNNAVGYDIMMSNLNSPAAKLSSRKRPRVGKVDEKFGRNVNLGGMVGGEGGNVIDNSNINNNNSNITSSSNINLGSTMQGLIEEAVRSCLSPMVKDLVSNTVNGTVFGGSVGGIKGVGALALNAVPLNFSGVSSAGSSGGDVMDEKWRNQQILELEVYSKRLELVQDQIKLSLEELRSMGS